MDRLLPTCIFSRLTFCWSNTVMPAQPVLVLLRVGSQDSQAEAVGLSAWIPAGAGMTQPPTPHIYSNYSCAAFAVLARCPSLILYLCLSLLLCLCVVGCAPQKPPPRRTIETRIPTCEEANRLAYRAVLSVGYAAASVQIAKPGQPGFIEAKKEDGKTGKVVITCQDESHATAVPDRTGEPVRVLVGAADKPGSFPHVFTQTYNIFLSSQNFAAQGPEQGMSMVLTRLGSFESQIELGADLPKSGVLPVKAVLTNNSPRPYGLNADKVFLSSAGGGQTAPMATPAAGQGKALQGEITLQPGQSITGYLFYPAGQYTSARTTLTDKENDEEEGFSVRFE